MLVKKDTLADKYVFELAKIFEKHNWDVEKSSNGEYSVFDMFCKRLEELETDSDRELMLELTHEYLLVSIEEYGKHMINGVRKFLDTNKESLKDVGDLHIFPVQDRDYPDKTKSGNVMCYLFQGVIMRKFEEFRNKRIRIIETFDGIEKYKENIECLLLVDDFVGSGDTLLGCINLIEERGIAKEKIKALTLVLQKAGEKAVKEYGIDIYSSILRGKAITDKFSPNVAKEKIEQMKNISKTIKVKDKNLYLGYKESEGLVTMIKTPNNTFPFYWHESRREGKLMVAPFARRNNVGVDV